MVLNASGGILMENEILWKDRKRCLFFGLPWSFTKYSLTADRLFIETGMLSTTENEVRLYRVMDLSLNRSLFQRIFGLGTIHCCTADKSMKDFDIINIKNAKEIKERIAELVEAQRDAKRVSSREFIGSDMDDDVELP